VRDRAGRFRQAEGGTLFLDEIAEIPLPLQAKLLRALQERTVDVVGGDRPVSVDVRIVAATNRDLQERIRDGAFREDLYYRLNVFSLNIPPLRERREDIPPLVEHFIRNSALVPKRTVRVTAEAMDVLQRYRWPGNVRELENVIERALILCDEGVLDPEHLPMGVRLTPQFSQAEESDHLPTLEEVERRYIRRVLEECKGHRHKAASILGISERNLYRKLKELEQAQGA
jgi:DNA-binding NtrC family response regulator